ncbi:FecCD family ABC transporter permease [Paenibacillus planticolens]|uniref:Iron chelate uptake ABC transporter family permease subunit n=1 Tax=Paenibacillus planticolens TaxID=2654976 RepID=A0ABX1ZXX2_9BACL|nr:iron ABC transporter permease [Paenibacillus planticolens]NOV04802.1 iron chelate uptake ABC transporter family permease subunit [Paenibacillus planticolens]
MIIYQKNVIWRSGMLVVLALFALLGLVLSLICGAVNITIPDVLRSLFGGQSTYHDIIWNIRLPRTIVAALVGISLSLSGALLQGVMRNSMADPHIIGVSSGAGLFGIGILILFPAYAYLLTPVAFVGAIGAALLIYLMAWRGGVSPLRVILAGVAVSALLNSGISALLTFYSDRVGGALMFMTGGLSARSWPHVYILLPYTLVGTILALMGSQRLNIMALGDAQAKGLGLRVELHRVYFTAIATLLAASTVSVVGLLGFVGMIVPHSARLLIGSDYRWLLPACVLLSVGVLTISDTIARILFAPVELPVGIVMGVLGAPFFLYLVRRRVL